MEKIHVLLVEDEQTLAMIIKDTLEEQDFIITTAGDGEEGLSKIRWKARTSSSILLPMARKVCVCSSTYALMYW